jgi:hypothetical protein
MTRRVSSAAVRQSLGAARDALLDLGGIGVILCATLAALGARLLTETLHVVVALAGVLLRAALIVALFAAGLFTAGQIGRYVPGGLEKAILIALALSLPPLFVLQHAHIWGALAVAAAVTSALGGLIGALDFIGHAGLITVLLALTIFNHQFRKKENPHVSNRD